MSILNQWWSNAPVTKSVSWVSFSSNIVGSMIFFWNKASKLVTRTCNYKLKLISGLIRELNPGPLTPKARIILLDQWADNVKDTLNLQFFITSVNINGLCHFLHHRLDGKIEAPGCFGNTGLRVRVPPKPEVVDILGSSPLHPWFPVGVQRTHHWARWLMKCTKNRPRKLAPDKSIPNQTKPDLTVKKMICYLSNQISKKIWELYE